MKEEPIGCEKESLMIIKVVSKVLDQLISGAKSPSSNLGLFVKFQSSYAPEVTVQSYLERIRKYSRCSDACFVMALIYIDRLIECRQLMLSQLNVHRLLVTCVMVAAKFHDDLFYNNNYYAKLGGLPLAELNLLEIDLLKLMNFSLFIDKDAYAKYYQELKNYFFCIDMVPSPVSVALATPHGGGGLNASFHAAPSSSPMAAGASVKGSNSCPNFANVVDRTSSAAVLEDYRVPTPRNPHDKAGSVNVSNEYYFGGYAASTANTAMGVDLHTSSESPEFVDGNSYIDYTTSAGDGYGGRDEYTVQFAHKGHQLSCDNVAQVMPLYLSPQPGTAPVRQVDRQTSSWHRSAALMVADEQQQYVEQQERGNLQVDTSCAEYDERVYGVYHHQQMELMAARQQQHHQHQQMLANQRAAFSYYERSLSTSAVPTYAQTGGSWFNNHLHQHQVPPLQQQQSLYYPSSHAGGYHRGGGVAAAAAPYLDVPNVVDIHGHYQPSYAMHTMGGANMSAAAAAPYVSVGGAGGRYHAYQRQHSA